MLTPTTKLLSLIIFLVLTLTFNHPLYLLPIFLTSLLLALCSKKTIKKIYQARLLLFILFVSSAILWNLTLQEGTLLYRWGAIKIHKESLLYGIGMGLRLTAISMAGIIFVSMTKQEEISFSLHQLGFPYSFSFAISMAFRLVPTFRNAVITVIEAQKSRGLDLENGNIFIRLKRHIPLIVPIFLSSIRNTDRLSMVIEAKGFSPKNKRTFYISSSTAFKDLIVLGLLFLILFFCLALRLRGYGTILNRI